MTPGLNKLELMRLTPTLPGIYVIYESFGIILYDHFVQLCQRASHQTDLQSKVKISVKINMG